MRERESEREREIERERETIKTIFRNETFFFLLRQILNMGYHPERQNKSTIFADNKNPPNEIFLKIGDSHT